MAREAARMSLGDASTTIDLKNIVWVSPIIIENEPREIHIGLFPEEDGTVSYEIYTGDNDDEIIVHSQGMAIIRALREEVSLPVLDIKTLKLTHNHKELSSEQFYEAIDRMGIQYGHRGIDNIL